MPEKSLEERVAERTTDEALALLAVELTETISSSVGTHLEIIELHGTMHKALLQIAALKKEFIAHTKEIAG